MFFVTENWLPFSALRAHFYSYLFIYLSIYLLLLSIFNPIYLFDIINYSYSYLFIYLFAITSIDKGPRPLLHFHVSIFLQIFVGKRPVRSENLL